jgi:PAS domain S-box-containing protein
MSAVRLGAGVPGSNLANLGSARTARKLPAFEIEVLASLPLAVIATDLSGYIIYWNRAAEQLYGWTADEVEGRNIIDVTPSAESRAAAVAIFDSLTKGESWSGTFETRHKDGHTLRVDVTDSPIRDQQGKLTAIVGLSKPAGDTEDVTAAPARGFHELMSWLPKRIRAAFARMPADSPRDLLRNFAIAGLLYGLACAVRIPLDLVIPDRLPFISFFPALMVSAYFCGLWPTIALLIAASATGALWTLKSDLWGFQILAGALFLVAGGAVVAPVVYARGIQRRLEAQDERLSLLNMELKHRLKNLFAVTSSICYQTIKSDIPRDQLARAVVGRIQAVGSAQDLLSATGGEGSDLRTLVDAVVKPLSPDASRLDIVGPPVLLPVEATMPFAMILHELATNAVKYGAWSSAQGRTLIEWHMPNGRQLEFRWHEEGAAVPSNGKRNGFGSVVIKEALSQAKVQHEIGPQGADCLIELTI